MNTLRLKEWHQTFKAHFTEVAGWEIPLHYGHPDEEFHRLQSTVGLWDTQFRDRLCLVGTDRTSFLHGQVTQDIKSLAPLTGRYAALVSNKGKLQGDAMVYQLNDEILLDLEPGTAARIQERLEHYIIAEDVQIFDASPHYTALSLIGPKSPSILSHFSAPIPPQPGDVREWIRETANGSIYIMSRSLWGLPGFDLFIPVDDLPDLIDPLKKSCEHIQGGLCGWQSLEWTRLEAGVPRFGADMNESHLAPETGMEPYAISYRKGCYIGQEVISRIRTYGQTAKILRRFRWIPTSETLPPVGTRILSDEGKEIGTLTSIWQSPGSQHHQALGYIRKEFKEPGTQVLLENQTPITVLFTQIEMTPSSEPSE